MSGGIRRAPRNASSLPRTVHPLRFDYDHRFPQGSLIAALTIYLQTFSFLVAALILLENDDDQTRQALHLA
jgi:hypothetical protein